MLNFSFCEVILAKAELAVKLPDMIFGYNVTVLLLMVGLFENVCEGELELCVDGKFVLRSEGRALGNDFG